MSNIKAIPARQALLRLIQGNKRFVRKRRDGKSPAQKDAEWLKVKPRGPFAIILSCSDSRAPAEIVFDQGLGDLFVIRVAGNIVAPSQVGSVEFAAATTQAKLVIVMGHSQCGAIRATLDAMEGRHPFQPKISSLSLKGFVRILRACSRSQRNLSSVSSRFGMTQFALMFLPRRITFVMAADFLRSSCVKKKSR